MDCGLRTTITTIIFNSCPEKFCNNNKYIKVRKLQNGKSTVTQKELKLIELSGWADRNCNRVTGHGTRDTISFHVHTHTHTHMDCGLQAADCALGIKQGLRYKTRTKHYGLGIKHGPILNADSNEMPPTDYSPCFILTDCN